MSAVAPQETPKNQEKEVKSAVRRYISRLLGSEHLSSGDNTAHVGDPELKMPEGLSAFEQKDWFFLHNFSVQIADLNFNDVGVPIENRLLPHNLGDFMLTALVDSVAFKVETYKPSSERAGGGYTSILKFHQATGNGIYLDTSTAIGFVYKNEINAISSAYLSPDDRIRITQIQGIKNLYSSHKKADRDRYENSGLHAGIDWKKTLVKAWIEIARKNGLKEIEILGAANGKYWNHPLNTRMGNEESNSRHNARLTKTYDELAKEMGFVMTPEENWLLNL